MNYAKSKNYKEIILEGHSYGCNKILYYYHHKKDNSIKQLILLAPCDIPSETKKFLSEVEYKKATEEATRLVQENIVHEFMAKHHSRLDAQIYPFNPLTVEEMF